MSNDNTNIYTVPGTVLSSLYEMRKLYREFKVTCSESQSF